MKKNYIMGIDVGTTGTKAAVLSADGELVSQAYREYSCTYPQPGWVEQDAAMLLTSTFETAAEVLRKSAINPADIAGISFSSQRCCTLSLDSTGALVRPMISWQDNRTSDEVELIRSSISDDEFYDICRLPLSTTWMISKIMWLQRHEPDAWSKTAKVVQLQDFLLDDLFLRSSADCGFHLNGVHALAQLHQDLHCCVDVLITDNKDLR